MKKILGIVSSCFIATTIYLSGNPRSISRITQSVNHEKKTLMLQGISTESVAVFKQGMQKNIELMLALLKDRQGDDKIELFINSYKDDIEIAETLEDYLTNPTEQKARYLREWANSDSFWAEMIIPEMNKQIEQHFKFNKSF